MSLLEKQFIIPNWIKRGALTNKMFERVTPPVWMKNQVVTSAKLEQICSDASLKELKTVFPSIWQKGKNEPLTEQEFKNVFYELKELKEQEVVINAQSLINNFALYYKDAQKKLLEKYGNAYPGSINANKYEKEMARLKAESEFLFDFANKYKDLTLIGFDYDSRWRKDVTPVVPPKGRETNYPVYDKSVRLLYNGVRSRTPKNYDYFREDAKSRDYTTVRSLDYHMLNIWRAVKNGEPITSMPDYEEFMSIVDQVKAAHAIVYYAGQIEEKHLDAQKNYNDPAVSKATINEEETLYNKAIDFIKYQWEVIKYDLILSVDDGKAYKLDIEEVAIEDENLSGVDADEQYTHKEFYNESLEEVRKITEQVIEKRPNHIPTLFDTKNL
ncbi:MAG: hypothetical protein AB7S44_03735 [Spirochaetales bacterium]